MPAINPLKAAAVADFAASVYRSDDAAILAAERGASRQEMALEVAAEAVDTPRGAGILAPALRARLDAMTQDYAKILTRLDQMAADASAMAGGAKMQRSMAN